MPSGNRDFNVMQEEALRRMREMQRRSKTAVSVGDKKDPPPQNVGQNMQKSQSHAPAAGGDLLSNLIGDLKIDPEKAMILMMLLILYKNKADMKLLLALGYLLM